MKVLIGNEVYDSAKQPVMLIFDSEKEQKIFNGMTRFVSAPESSTAEERQKLIDKEL